MREVSGRRRHLSQVVWMGEEWEKTSEGSEKQERTREDEAISRNEVQISLAKAEGPFVTISNEVLLIEQLSCAKHSGQSCQCLVLS